MFQDTPSVSLGRFKRTFSAEFEQKLADHFRAFDNTFFGFTKFQARQLAYEYAVANKIDHPFNTETKLAGEKWLSNFLSRHGLSTRQPEKCSAARASGFNKVQVKRFFDNLEECYKKYDLPPHRVLNVDESGISTVVNKLPKVCKTCLF